MAGKPRRARGPGEGEQSAKLPPGERAARAIASFLDAVVPPEARADGDLDGTPERVAEAWLGDLLSGYRDDPAAALAETMPSRGRDLVAVTNLDFHSMCPHHLLPSRGVAHVGYVPGERMVGFGQLARLVDVFAHRLTLEEDVARRVAEALMTHLGARGAACVLDAEQSCLTVRGERRPAARAHAQCFLGTLATEPALQRRFQALLPGPGALPQPARLRGGRAAAVRRARR